jgi:hypothetical protein
VRKTCLEVHYDLYRYSKVGLPDKPSWLRARTLLENLLKYFYQQLGSVNAKGIEDLKKEIEDMVIFTKR